MVRVNYICEEISFRNLLGRKWLVVAYILCSKSSNLAYGGILRCKIEGFSEIKISSN